MTIQRLGLVFSLAFVFSLSLPVTATADISLLNILPDTWEVSLPSAEEIKDQGKYPYCGIYAMSSYLELWAKGGRPSAAFPSVDPAFVAMGYNRLVANGDAGTNAFFLSVTTQMFGAIPAGSLPSDSSSKVWPLGDWRESHRAFMKVDALDLILKAKYAHRSASEPFNGNEYLSNYTRINFRSLVHVFSNYQEKLKKDNDPGNDMKPQWRDGDFAKAAVTMEALAKKLEMNTQFLQGPPSAVYKVAVAQLYRRRPVYLGFNVGLTMERFRNYRVIAGRDLVEPGEGKMASHAVVLVAHCDQKESNDHICKMFAPYMTQRKVTECVVVQNSWGADVHDKGYVCLSPEAFNRMGRSVVIEKAVFDRYWKP